MHDQRVCRRWRPHPSPNTNRPGSTWRTCPSRTTLLDGAQPVEFPRGERRSLRHRGSHRSVDAQHDPSRPPGGGTGRPRDDAAAAASHGVGGHPDEDRRVGLDHRAVEHPRVARPDPADRVRDQHRSSSSQMQASVAVLPEPTIDVLRWRRAEPDQLVDRARPALRPQRRTAAVLGRYAAATGSARRPPGSAAATSHRSPRQTRHELPLADVVTVRVEGHLPRREHPRPQHSCVVRADLRRRRALLQAGFWPVAPEPRRRRAAWRPRRRTRTPGAGGRRGRRPASGRPRRGDDRPRATLTSAWSISASVNAIPAAPAPTTR